MSPELQLTEIYESLPLASQRLGAGTPIKGARVAAALWDPGSGTHPVHSTTAARARDLDLAGARQAPDVCRAPGGRSHSPGTRRSTDFLRSPVREQMIHPRFSWLLNLCSAHKAA